MATDILYRRIYNYVPVIIISLSLILFFFSIQLSLFVPIIVLIIGFVLFVSNVWGAGDAKFCFVLTLSLPSELIFLFFLVMSVSGGIIAIIMLAFPRVKGRFESVPYGLAIGTGYLFTLMTGILNGSINLI
ncbi:prepilin peptidase [Salmonella enterica]|nr:flp operon protein B [Salmonella enterica]EEK2973965.1 flp operon protein B [Salmonella enterica]EFB7478724.1 flp operon protein B [Salmonella enterica subsp. enterica serovar Newport]EMD2586655.1 prepilin peptidase [Salmonella enterica]